MEHTSDLVAEGRLVEETTYNRRSNRYEQIQIDGIKIDYYDAKQGIIKEVKKSSKREAAHEAQVKYYLYVLRQHGVDADHALLEYPKLRETAEVYLDPSDHHLIEQWCDRVRQIVKVDACPDRIKKSLCKHCAYYEFCYADEEPIA